MDDEVLTAPGSRAGQQVPIAEISVASRPPRGLSQLTTGSARRLVADAPEGIALLDSTRGEYLYVNPSGCLLLERALADLVGDLSPFTAAGEGGSPKVARQGRHEFEYSNAELPGVRVVYFRDVSRQRAHERLLAAFSRTSASLAFAGPLASVLDRLAEEVCHATGMASCTFLLMGDDGHLREAGMASMAYPGVSDYAERLERCRVLGAPLLSLEAFHHRKLIVAHGWRQQTLSDPRFAPIHDITATASWSSMVVVPLIGRGNTIGVMNGYYPEGSEPLEQELTFLAAIADQAAVAVENARLVGAWESKAALEERHRIARELHDSVNQALFSLTLQTRAMEIGMTRGSMTTDAVLRGLTDVRELTEGALSEMRALIFQLRPAALREEGLVLAVRKHAAAISAREGLAVRVDGPADPLPLDEAGEEQLFRVVQEALHNVVKHAQATNVLITVTQTLEHPQALRLTIADDGVGFDTDTNHPGHLGLQTMAERVAQIDGVFTLRSVSGGTTIIIDVPRAPMGGGDPR